MRGKGSGTIRMGSTKKNNGHLHAAEKIDVLCKIAVQHKNYSDHEL